MATTKQVIFDAGEAFQQADDKDQIKGIAAWAAANPDTRIVVQGEWKDLPPYIRKTTGKRATIVRMFLKGPKVTAFNLEAKKLGGGWEDIRAALNGSYSNRGGVAAITLQA